MTTQQIVSRELAFKRNLKKVKFICIKFRNEVLLSTEIYQHIHSIYRIRIHISIIDHFVSSGNVIKLIASVGCGKF